MVNVTGIVINIIMAIIIILIALYGVMLNSALRTCETKQSPFCYTINCPCDNQTNGPCLGYAKMPAGPPDQWYCSSAPLSIVDNNGNPV